MDPLLTAAASGMKARLESLDMLANNLANTGTAGFKADREFYTVFEQELPVIEREWTDLSQGTLLPTGNPLDLALSGPGWFALNSPKGIVYTRNGDFRVSKNNELETPQGYTLRNVEDRGRPIRVDPFQPIAVAKDGTVSQGSEPLGKIEIAGSAPAPENLSKLGNSYFALTQPSSAVAPAPADTHVEQGSLEQSNVQVAESAVRLVNVLRQFEMLQKAVSLSAEMDHSAIQEVAKVS